jgi:hypothetical protein
LQKYIACIPIGKQCFHHMHVPYAPANPPPEAEVTLRLTVGQSACLGVKPTLGFVTKYYFLSESCCQKVVVLFLWGALSDERTGL